MGSIDLPLTPWFGTSALTSDELRYALGALTEVPATANIGSETGVFPGVSALLVTTASSTSVSVAPGACAVQTPVGGTYIVTVAASATVPVTSQASNSRIDLVCVRVLDSESGDGLGTTIRGRILTVEGSAASSPSAPATPTGYVVLAQLLVNSGGITVNDRRQFTRASGGVRVASANDTRNGSYPGDERTWPNGQKDVWTGSAWLTVISPAAWTTTAATWNYAGAGSIAAGSVAAGSSGSSTVAYKLAGKDLQVDYNLALGGSGVSGGAGGISVQLPAGLVAARGGWIPCHLFVAADPGFNDTAVDVSGMAVIDSGSSTIRPLFPIGVIPSAGIDLREAQLQNAGSSGGRGTGSPLIPNSWPLVPGTGLHVGPGLIQVQ